MTLERWIGYILSVLLTSPSWLYSIMATSIPLLSNPAHHSTHDFPSPPPFNTSKYHLYKGHILQEMANPDPDMGRLKLMKMYWELILREFSFTSPHHA
jgi:hypothetical protein